eukprot:5311751-Prorocentrum_lima.AAC.1
MSLNAGLPLTDNQKIKLQGQREAGRKRAATAKASPGQPDKTPVVAPRCHQNVQSAFTLGCSLQ